MNNNLNIKYIVIAYLFIALFMHQNTVGQDRLYPREEAIKNRQKTIDVLKQIADRIMQSTTYQFINKKTDSTYSSIKDLPLSTDIQVESQYNDWHYTNGMLHIGFLEVAELFDDAKYSDYVMQNFNFVMHQGHLEYFEKLYNQEIKKGWQAVRRVPWHMYFRMVRLDDCSAIAASLIEVQMLQEEKDPKYEEYINEVAYHIMEREPRIDDGTIARFWPHEKTIWADDLFMSISFLARMGKYTGDSKYFNEAAKQVILFTKYLWCKEKQLYYHCYHSDIEQTGVAHWARANGWVMMAQADLLSVLPEDHPQRPELIQIFQQQVQGIALYQSKSGLWHQLLDKSDSYLETSSSAMFTFSIARGVNRGWLPKDYAYVAETGWNGVLTKIDDQSNVSDICVGTGIMPSLVFYYWRPVRTNIPMGEGPILRAGAEILKMNKYSSDPAYAKYDRILDN